MNEKEGERPEEVEKQIVEVSKKVPFVPNYVLLLQAMKDFVDCLCDVFKPKRQTPLGRYKRLILYVKPTDGDALKKFIEGFHSFFIITNLNKIGTDAVIKYKENIYLPVGKFIGSPETMVIITHLKVIKSLLYGVSEDTSLSVGGREEELINILIEKIGKIMNNLKADDGTDAMQKLFADGSFIGMFKMIQDAIANEEVDPAKLLMKLQSIIPKMLSGANGMDMSQFAQFAPMIESVIGSMGGLKV